RRRMAFGREVREPTLLALALTVTGFIVLLAAGVVAMAGLPALGYLGWTSAAVAGSLAWLVLGFRRNPKPDLTPATGRPRWFRRLLRLARWSFIGVLACWLGLIGWLVLGPGGPAPAPKADPALIRVVTWNIHCGQDEGPPWKQFDWPARKQAL